MASEPICSLCGLPESDGDAHALVRLGDGDTLVFRCRIHRDGWNSIYSVAMPTLPPPRIYFSKIFDPNEWSSE